MRQAALLMFLLSLNCVACMHEFSPADESSKNLCDENAQCIDGYTCVCKMSNHSKICVKNPNEEMVLANKSTVCEEAQSDTGPDAETDAEVGTSADVDADSNAEADAEVGNPDEDSSTDTDVNVSTDVKPDFGNEVGPDVQPDAEQDGGQDVSPDNGTDSAPDSGEDIPCTPSVEICDGIDNDCDNQTDEGFDNLNQFCSVGLGLCENEGIYVCSSDRSTTVCNVAALQAYPEECDEMDNDCDGLTDEELVGCCDADAVQECGSDVGECQKGQMTCQEDGSWSSCENAVGPTVDLCDSMDNDCDGNTDEDFVNLGSACQIGQGLCLSHGNYACTDDMFGTFCAAMIIQSSNEACDQQDNDCDGATDEDLAGCCTPDDQVECGSDVGECHKGHKTCSVDGVWSECINEVRPSAELCDNKDNNCDNQTDETFANLSSFCEIGQGECFSIGRIVCAFDQHSTSCDAQVVIGNDEICDNNDNDCDGDTDEDLTQECGSDVGECHKGIQSCFAGGWLVCEGEVQSSDEICDSLDNNCDGNTDEGFNIGDYCTDGLGECQAEGVFACVDNLNSDCNAVVGQQSEEICDGLDNDCDGNTDEDLEGCCLPGTISECGIDTGECAKGTYMCQEDRTWGWCMDSTGPSNEICDGLDNNCDGETDEGLTGCCSPGVSRNCGSDEGECNHGTQICWETREWGDCQNQTLPANEICDGLDNDCDGQTDNSFDLMVEANNCGQCNHVCGSQGTVSSTCEAGECALTCSRFRVDLNTDATDGCECEVTNCGVEICDQVDNDCDGAIDEDCDSLVMYLSFDGHMNDGSPNANNALNHGATYTADAVCGQAASFDGVDDFAEVADSVSMDSIENEFTFFVSVMTMSYEAGDLVFSKYRQLPALGIDTNGQELRWTYFMNRIKLAQTNTVSIGQWYVLAGRYQQGVLTAFIDGVQVWQGNAQNPVGAIMYIAYTGGTQYSNMRIDEFSFFNKAFSEAEIQHYFTIMNR